MRLLGNIAQFIVTIFVLRYLGKILPFSVSSFCENFAHVLLCLCITWWLVELTEHYFFTSTVKTRDKAILITGCDSGFGNAIAKRLDKKGFKVYACCLDPSSDGANALKDTCTNRLKVIDLDVTKDESVEQAVEFVSKDLDDSVLWAVINNAGVLRGFQTELSSLKDYENCFQVNTLGVIRVTRFFLPLLRKSKGRIVNVCSKASRISTPFLGAYCTSKFATIGFTEALRYEMEAFGINVISIEPEFFGTPICSNEYISKIIEDSISSASDDVKAAYGEKYIRKAKKNMEIIFAASAPDITPVLDALDAAVSLTHPAIAYKPCRNKFSTLLFALQEKMPKIINDIFMHIIVLRLPKPISVLQRH